MANKVYRYTPEMQKAFRSSVKSEPWLHCCIKQFGKPGELGMVIFVWDTREIVGDAFIQTYVNRGSMSAIQAAKQPAIDNGMPLKGKDADNMNKLYGFDAYDKKAERARRIAAHKAADKHTFEVQVHKGNGNIGTMRVKAVDKKEAGHKAWRACGHTKATAGWQWEGVYSIKQLD